MRLAIGQMRSHGSAVALREVGLVALAFLAAALALTWPLAARLRTALPGGLGDPLLNAWTLAWGCERLAHGLQGFWTPPAFYPYAGALAYSENLLGISLLVAPVHWIGQNLVLTYNVAFLLSYVIAGVGMFLLARDLTGRFDAALVAASFYAFCPYRAAQLVHLQVLMSGWLPLALWALHRFLRTSRVSWLLLFAAAFLLQTLSNMYALVFALLPAGALLVWALGARQVRARSLVALAVAALVVGIVLMPVAAAYRSAWSGLPDSREVVRYAADLGNYLQVTPSIWHARWLPGPRLEEGNLFPGMLVLALATLALAYWLRRRISGAHDERLIAAAPYVLAGVVAALLSLGPEPRAWGHVIPGLGRPYQAILSLFPTFAVLRVPARFGTVVMLAFAVVAAAGASHLFGAIQRSSWRRLVLSLIVAVIGLEGWPGRMHTSEFTLFRDNDEKAVYNSLRHRAPAPMLELPLVSLGSIDNSYAYQCAALFHRHPIVNGMSRRSTPLQWLLGSAPGGTLASAAGVPDAVELLRGMGVEYVVIHPRLYRDPTLAAATIDAFASQHGSVVERWGSSSIAVFQLAPAPRLETPRGNRVPGTAITARASDNTPELALAFDGDPITRWTTNHGQQGGEWVELALDRPRHLVRIDFTLPGDALADYPRELEIESVDEFGATRSVYRGTTLAALGAALRRDQRRVSVQLPLPENRTSLLRLRQRGANPSWFWSIYEVGVWEAPAGGAGD